MPHAALTYMHILSLYSHTTSHLQRKASRDRLDGLETKKSYRPLAGIFINNCTAIEIGGCKHCHNNNATFKRNSLDIHTCTHIVLCAFPFCQDHSPPSYLAVQQCNVSHRGGDCNLKDIPFLC